MGQALYRKYRPTSFAEVVNQEHIKTTLQHEIEHQQFAHAYLFSGPRGVGKTTVARLLAKAVNAAAIERHHLQAAQLLDIIEIDAASHTGVDHVRENIIQNARTAPSQLQYKVFIIDEVHMLSVSAFNALLKILEEPPAHVIFILATTEVHKVPATVISRCQRFDFHTIRLPDIVQRLHYICQQEAVQVDVAVLERIAHRAGGAIRDAESMLGQLLSLGEHQITPEQADIVLPRVDITLALTLFDQLIKKQAKLYLQTIQQAVDDGVHLKELHLLLLEIMRQGLLYSIDQSLEHFAALDIHASAHNQLVELMRQSSTADCLRLIDLFTAAGQEMNYSQIAQLPLETAGISWCSGGGSAVPPPVTVIQKPAPFTTATVVQPTTKATTSKIMPTEMSQRIKDHWPEIVRRVRELNHALALSLSVSQVIGVVPPDTLQLGLRYDFHKQRLCETEHQHAVEQVIADVTGDTVKIACVVGQEYEVDIAMLATLPSDNLAAVPAAEADNIWDLALQTIGGKEVK